MAGLRNRADWQDGVFIWRVLRAVAASISPLVVAADVTLFRSYPASVVAFPGFEALFDGECGDDERGGRVSPPPPHPALQSPAHQCRARGNLPQADLPV